jgi:Lamin Tail Domain/Secretion system C-terminal sorting domain
MNYFYKHLRNYLLSMLFFSLAIQAKDFVLINKIMYDTPLNEQIATGVAYSNGEYLELYNAGIETANLSGWVLRGGGSTELFYFPSNTTMAPKTYLIVAYQYNNSGFTLDQLYTGLTPTTDHQILYQRKIVWSNSGEPAYLRDNYGVTRDSIYYDGTSSKTKPNRLSAENVDGLAGNSCVCLQRKTAVFTNDACAIPNNLEWATALVNPFHQYPSFIQPVLPGVGISYAYDYAGNRISRKQVTLGGTLSHVRKKNSSQEPVPTPVEEKSGERTITVYPNPTKGVLAVGISGEILQKISVILYNAQGNMMQNIQADSDITNLEMSTYPTGWYLLRVIADGKATEFKIIKQ